uniref:NADH-ubiquinone oxidoreductase chain 3 n=1 Tax=Angiostrongylus costaricensis TaxID=334426 RepID=A0A0K1L5R0_ANGCS|nr:NADH dehydrogenase subunit 3 [Angiostrongylus costaricensis]BAV82630.1 NADH dehydrogenase subunit 3 [Angiostrongylus costaricensis]
MVSLFVVILIALFLIFFLYVLNFFLSLKEDIVVKIFSFESGFLGMVKIQNSFSIHFFVLMLMFVIFDLEIVMFLGLLVSDISSLLGVFFLLVFVMGGFYMEWFYGKLMWMV